MDPNETLRLIENACLSGEYVEAYDRSMDLQVWLDAGGFQPNWDNYPNGDRYFHEQFEG